MATEPNSKKMKKSDEEEDLLRNVLLLRTRAPEQYRVNLLQQNTKYFQNLSKIDTAPNEPFAPDFEHQPLEIDLGQDLFEKSESMAREIQRKAENIAKCLTMRREHNSSR